MQTRIPFVTCRNDPTPGRTSLATGAPLVPLNSVGSGRERLAERITVMTNSGSDNRHQTHSKRRRVDRDAERELPCPDPETNDSAPVADSQSQSAQGIRSCVQDGEKWVTEIPFRATKCLLCSMDFLTARELANHWVRHGTMVELVFACSTCKRSWEIPHSTICHIPRCKGPAGPVVVRNHVYFCEECLFTAASKRGVSQHERFAHPELRNAGRSKKTRSVGGPGTTGKVWQKPDYG